MNISPSYQAVLLNIDGALEVLGALGTYSTYNSLGYRDQNKDWLQTRHSTKILAVV